MDIGIDLGTTFSVIAVNGRKNLALEYPPGIYLEECDVTVIPTPFGEQTFPSVIWEDPQNPGDFLYGTEAIQKSEEGWAPAIFTKRKIGTMEPIPLGCGTVHAKDVACKFLRYLKSCAEQALGCAVTRAVITHPAYFDRGAVEETREAAIEAGFDMSLPEQMLMEPIAAALAYARTDSRDPLRILTYDLGGGTFDVTYLERNGGVIEMKAFDGNHLLGGYNFDRELVHWVRERLQAQGRQIVLDEDSPEDRGRLARLLRVAENVKIALANARSDSQPVDFRARDILVDVQGHPVQINERISREQFVGMIRSHLDKTIECCQRALEKAGVSASDLNQIILVGGSTYAPWIAQSLGAAFGSTVAKLFNPDLCVGVGAAIHAKMALPPLTTSGNYKLVLDVPNSSPFDSINVAGKCTLDDKPAPLTVTLRLPDASLLGPVVLSQDGGFFFENVDLMHDEPSRFALTFKNESGGFCVLQNSFEVQYSPETSDISGITTVLPRPLFVETIDGLVPLAEEGVSLPSRREQTFKRENDNPNISLRLFQEKDPIGEIRIENIPPEGGRGSFVDLSVEITEKNQIRGIARVRTRSGKVVAESPVRVHFESIPIPSAYELREEFDALCLLHLESAGEASATPDHAIRKQKVESLMRTAEHLFEQQPLERQEIAVALKELRQLIIPPADQMNPSRSEFSKVVEDCRKALEEMVKSAESTLSQQKTPGEKQTDQGLIDVAEKNLRKAKYYQPLIDRLEQHGLAAYERRDQRAWLQAHEGLGEILVRVRKRPKTTDLPPFLAKLIAGFEILRLLGQVDQGETALGARGLLNDWQGEIDRLRARLQEALEKVQDIDDNIPTGQGRAQVGIIFTRIVDPIRKDIEKLGADVSQVVK